MLLTISTFALLFVALWTISTVPRWRKYYKLAQATKFPACVCPVHLSDAWWMIFYPVLLPILERLPSAWTKPWLSMSKTWRIWKTGYLPFEEAGADTFVLSTPKGNILWTCDHSVIHDLFVQHPKVQIPVDLLGFYDIWGPTIGSVDGEEWKAHRRVVSAGFGNSMNSTVWKEAQYQTRTLVDHWITQQNSTIPVMGYWTSRLALHVITSGFFNTRLDWKKQELQQTTNFAKGQKLECDEAIILLMKRLATIFMTPRPLLSKLPFKMFQEANLGLSETERYITQQRATAEADIDNIIKKRNPSILEAIVISGRDPAITNRSPFLEKSVLGNMFFTLMAGHETVGSSLGFIFIFAALYPDIQRKIQTQLDDQFSTRPSGQWTLEQDYPALQKSYIGAVQREVLSIYHPASFFLRKIAEPVTVTDSDGVAHDIPVGTIAMINVSAAYKNPKIWHRPEISSTRKSALSNSPALYFNPDRWLDETGNIRDIAPAGDKGRTVPDYWAFGQGPRACPGKAFAQIETTAAMASVFKDYSLKLVVSDDMVSACGGDKRLAWEKTRDEGIRMLYDDIAANMTISLPLELPIRVVKRI